MKQRRRFDPYPFPLWYLYFILFYLRPPWTPVWGFFFFDRIGTIYEWLMVRRPTFILFVLYNKKMWIRCLRCRYEFDNQ
jgi:hypothetical protein